MRTIALAVFRGIFWLVAKGERLVGPLFKLADKLTAWMSK